MRIEQLYKELEELEMALQEEYQEWETNWASNLECAYENIEALIWKMEQENLQELNAVEVTDIKWDTDNQTVDLPTTVLIPMDTLEVARFFDPEDYWLTERLSEEYGYCLCEYATRFM